MPSVCICVPAYNSGNTIGETLESLINQTYSQFKIVVVDNNSTDHTRSVVNSMIARDSRITLVENSQNIGAEGNFNRCIQLADGDFTGIFHADDVYEPTILEKQIAFLQRHPEAGAVFTRARYIGENGEFAGFDALAPELSGKSGSERTYCFEEIFKLTLRDSNFIICPSALVRTGILKQHVRFWDGASFRSSADLGVWFKILERFRIGILPEPLIRYRQMATQGTAALLHLNTERAHFFLVIDHYLKNLPAGIKISDRDLKNLRFLLLRDDCRRAANCLITGKFDEARALTRGALSPAMLRIALFTRPPRLVNHSRLFFWVYGCLLFTVARTPMNSALCRALAHFKYGHVAVGSK